MATDEQAAILLHHVALPIVGLVHEDDVDEAAAFLDRCDPAQVRQLCVLLAAMVDPDRPWTDALGWWTDPPAKRVALFDGEVPGAPRPLNAVFLPDVLVVGS